MALWLGCGNKEDSVQLKELSVRVKPCFKSKCWTAISDGLYKERGIIFSYHSGRSNTCPFGPSLEIELDKDAIKGYDILERYAYIDKANDLYKTLHEAQEAIDKNNYGLAKQLIAKRLKDEVWWGEQKRLKDEK